MRPDPNVTHIPPRGHWNYYFNDTEPAFVPAPGHECCDKYEDCVCVTEEDVAAWNTISSLSSLTSVDFSNLSSYSAIAGSAELWNDEYNTVSANSANWNNVSGLTALSGLNSAFWEDASNTVSTFSGNWNKSYNYKYQIDENTSAINALSSLFYHNVRPVVDQTTIIGDGTSGSPYTVKNYENFIKILNYYVSAVKPLYKDNNQNWLSLDAETDSDGINPYLKTLFNAINKKDNDQDITLNNHGDLIQWILKNMNRPETTGTDLLWTNIPTPTAKSDLAKYTDENTIYYSYTD